MISLSLTNKCGVVVITKGNQSHDVENNQEKGLTEHLF